jgi:VanZ family protein
VNSRLRAALRDFRRPALWLGIWYFGWLLCVVLSLVPPPPLDVPVPEGDKLGHFLAYGLLSAWAVWLFASVRAHRRAAWALCALGVLLELAQGAFTRNRMMDPWDALADAAGVLAGLLLASGPLAGLLLRLDRAGAAPR